MENQSKLSHLMTEQILKAKNLNTSIHTRIQFVTYHHKKYIKNLTSCLNFLHLNNIRTINMILDC